MNDNRPLSPMLSSSGSHDYSSPQTTMLAKPDGYRYGAMYYDHPSGLPYFLEWPTNRFLYRYPPCRICGCSPWFYSPDRPDRDICGICSPERREANDVEF